ncbi:unnamed protein product [Boreogadus saida]
MRNMVSEMGFVRSRGNMENKSFPELGLPVVRPKEENTEEWSSADAAQYHPEAAGSIAGLAAVDGHLVDRLPKFSGTMPLEPYLTQFRISARHYDESTAQLALELEGTAVLVLLDLAPVDKEDLGSLGEAFRAACRRQPQPQASY